MATDDYVKSLAALIKSRLDPGLHVYVEWSDEIWNYGNPYWTETNYNADQMTALLADSPTAAANYAANCVGWANAECHVAERVKQFGDDFASVYGQTAIPTTIRPVLCTQVVQPVFLVEALRFIAKTYGPPANYFYGTCGAPYWSPDGAQVPPSGATVSQVVAAMDQAIPNNVSFIEADAAMDLYYGLHNLTYEGGPALSGLSSVASADVLAAANLAPGMQANVSNSLTSFFQHGGDMYMYYSLQGSGSYWGATPDPLDLHAPKYLGLRATAGQHVTCHAGTTLPGIITMAQPAFALLAGTPVPTYQMRNCWSPPSGNTSPSNCSFTSSVAVGDGYGYLVDVVEAGNFSVSLGMVNASAASSLELSVDGKSTGTFAIPKTPSGTTPSVTPLTVTLSAGLHVIELLNAAATTSCAVHNIQFANQ